MIFCTNGLSNNISGHIIIMWVHHTIDIDYGFIMNIIHTFIYMYMWFLRDQ